RGVPAHQPARPAAPRSRRPAPGLLLLLPSRAGRTRGRRPARITPPRPVRAARHRRRPVAGPSRAPGHRRNTLPARLPVPGDQLMLVYPDLDPVAFAAGPVKVHWYGIMYVVG